MLDRYIIPRLQPPLNRLARQAARAGLQADTVTVAGFLAGLLAVAAVALDQFWLALLLLLMNRLADGVDGELARLQGSSDAGAYLDITLDFVFYALFPVGFAWSDPTANAIPALVLVASFMGTGASFLAFSSFAEKRAIRHPQFGYKGLYYLDGLAEGSETVLCFVAMCLWPSGFAVIAWLFAAVCMITTVNRVIGGYRALRQDR